MISLSRSIPTDKQEDSQQPATQQPAPI